MHAWQHSTSLPVLLVIHHLEHPFLGHAEIPLREAGLELDQRFRRRGDELPALSEVDGVLVFGGEQSAVDTDGDAVLGPEAALLRDAVSAELPVLGICLGGQLLAHALGGTVRHEGRLVGWRDLERTAAGREDALFGGLDDPVPALHFNEDVFDAPPGAVVLAGPAPSGTAAFRAGPRAWGVQYHPDADGEVLDRWMRDYAHEIPDLDGLRRDTAERLDAQARASAILFGAFVRIVLEDAAARAGTRHG
jgi:GMP synthase-like glutamine amidotransferase